MGKMTSNEELDHSVHSAIEHPWWCFEGSTCFGEKDMHTGWPEHFDYDDGFRLILTPTAFIDQFNPSPDPLIEIRGTSKDFPENWSVLLDLEHAAAFASLISKVVKELRELRKSERDI
jgi:hypothetical protein